MQTKTKHEQPKLKPSRAGLQRKTSLRTKTALKARTKPKKQPKPSITKLRKRADYLLSAVVRYRDGKLQDGEWLTQCITCDRWGLFKKMHAGHFQSRRYPATRWNEENVNGQCAGCNMFNNGEQYKYGLAVDLKYGDGTAKKLYNLAHQEFKVTRASLEELIADLQVQLDFYEQQV